MVWVPALAVGRYPTWQLELSGSAAMGARTQFEEEKLPVSSLLNSTVPVGLDLVPKSMSLTWTTQTVPWLIATEAGEQLTEVVVSRRVTRMVSVPMLVA